MLSLPDFQEKKLVYVTSMGEEPDDLKFSNDNIVLYKRGKKVSMISCHLVFGIFLIGDMTITTVLIRKTMQYGISIFLLDNSLRCYSAIGAKAEGNYRLRRIQYLMGVERKLELTRWIVENKIKNQNRVINQYNLKEISGLYKAAKWNLKRAKNIDSIRGIEGNFSREYFSRIFEKSGWMRRSPRTKDDITNLLLDIGYTFLFNYVDAVLNIFGFDSFVSFYHQLFFQRKSLSCDLMEPMRVIIDKALYKAYNLGRVCEDDFGFKNSVYFFRKFDDRKKYAELFLEAIHDNKEGIYKFVQQYYRHLHKPEEYFLPVFKPK